MYNSRNILVAIIITFFLFSTNSSAKTGKNEEAIQRAYNYALEKGFIFAKTEKHLENLVSTGYWAELDDNSPFYKQFDVKYPYVRHEVKAFVDHISPRYKTDCSEFFGNTGGSRHEGFVPLGAHANTVHNAGMAIDLRNSTHFISQKCSQWLSIALERYKELGLIDYFPEVGYPHFHVMVYGSVQDFEDLELVITIEHRVKRGETLSSISRKYDVPLGEIVALNNIKNINKIRLNQKLLIP